jgi:hypothetical protein
MIAENIKPRVFVTQETPHNFLDAEQYGEIVFLTRDDLNNTKNSLHNDHLLRVLSVGLSDFDQDRDIIIIAGSPYVSAAAFLILGHMKIRRVKLLRWNNRDQIYVPSQIELRRETLDN